MIKKLKSKGLINRIELSKNTDGHRDYTHLYNLSPELKQRVVEKDTTTPFTEMRVHHIQMKFKIIRQSAPPTKDKRTSFNNSWFLAGKSERFRYWFVGKAGLPSVSITVHPGTMVIQMDRHQKIQAATMKEAEEKGLLACYQAKEKFIEEQSKFGIRFETEHTGKRIGKTHVGLAFHEGGPLDSEIRIPGVWADDSPPKEGIKEVEMHIDHELATPLERAVMSVATIEKKVDAIEDKLPEMFRGMIDPLNQNVLAVMAQLQGGRPIEAMFQQAVGLLAQMMEKMNRMDEEIKELKGMN